ncbi:hypothetical protein [Neoroseomonas lacus]|uniref:Lipoprotein n=1 Tax=Neoroseomonas lacus TaxID=287609 RepID=A0A917L295_9PROT|nr:hypothetical protein [Neoroseomonas lacus]GGJ39243.1 hypothetical protein GCM10011320_53600 [Neoroseomonas lacus]
MLQRREILPVIIAAGVSLGLGACRQDTVYQSTGGQFPGTGTMEQREALIRRAASAEAGWSIQPVRQGVLRATNSWNTHQMTVDITFDIRSFTISYVDSVDLDYDGTRIHTAYNGKVRALETAILRGGA